MTALRIYRTARPQHCQAPIHPMSREDRDFWRIVARERAETAKCPLCSPTANGLIAPAFDEARCPIHRSAKRRAA